MTTEAINYRSNIGRLARHIWAAAEHPELPHHVVIIDAFLTEGLSTENPWWEYRIHIPHLTETFCMPVRAFSETYEFV